MAEEVEAGRRAGSYRGTVALSVAVPGRPPERGIALLALDAWETCWQLRGTATLDAAEPYWFPGSWRVETDAGVRFTLQGGGVGSRGWNWRFEPSLPEAATRLRVYIGPDGRRRPDDADLPAAPSVEVALARWPARVRRAESRLDADAEPGPPPDPSGPLASLVPDRIVVVGTRVDDVAGRDLSVLSLDVRTGGFLLHIGGDGHLPTRPEEQMRRVHRRWEAEDDRGGHYAGTVTGTHSGYPWTATAALSPTLDPAATALSLAFPYPFGPGVVRTTVALPSGDGA